MKGYVIASVFFIIFLVNDNITLSITGLDGTQKITAAQSFAVLVNN